MEIEQEVREIFQEYQNNVNTDKTKVFEEVFYSLDPEDPDTIDNPSYYISTIAGNAEEYAVSEFMESLERLEKMVDKKSFWEALLFAMGGRDEVKKVLIRKNLQYEKFNKSF